MTKWQKKLTAKERRHLRGAGVHNLTQLRSTLEKHSRWREKNPDAPDPCWECRQVGRKLGLCE